MEPTNEGSKSAFHPSSAAPDQQPQQQHPLPFRPVVSPLARACSNTSLGPVVTPTKGGKKAEHYNSSIFKNLKKT